MIGAARTLTPTARALMPALLLGATGCRENGATSSRAEPGSVDPGVDVGVVLSAESPPELAPLPKHAVGAVARIEGCAVTLEAVQPCEVRGTTHPRKGNRWLGAKVSVEATGPELVVSPRDAKLVDATGHELRIAPVETSCAPLFEERRLTARKKADGWLVFEVPEATQGLELFFEPIVEPRGVPAVFELDR